MKPQSRSCRFASVALVLLGCGVSVACLASNRTAAPAASGREIIREASETPPSQETLRIAQFNIHSGRDREKRYVLDQLPPHLTAFDIVGLNEVSVDLVGSTDQAAVVAAELGMGHLFAPSERRWFGDYRGNALLSKLPVAHWQQIPLVCTSGKGYRNLVLASVPLGDDDVTLMITHLDRKADREAHLDTVLNLFMLLEPPVVLLGDLNTNTGDPRIRALIDRGDACDAIDLHAGPNPPDKLNWILVRGLEVRNSAREDLGLSDHPLYWAEIALPTDASARRREKTLTGRSTNVDLSHEETKRPKIVADFD